MVERRLGLAAESPPRDFGSLERFELSREDSREDAAVEGGATGRYVDECCLHGCKQDCHNGQINGVDRRSEETGE